MQEFDSKLTETKPFFLGSEKSKVNAKMMRLTGIFRCGEIDSLDAQFVQLPYKVLFLECLVFSTLRKLIILYFNTSPGTKSENDNHFAQQN